MQNDLKKLKEDLQKKEESIDECIKKEEESEREKNVNFKHIIWFKSKIDEIFIFSANHYRAKYGD